ncbi:hypothetical protein Trco_003614 [Trichoderma cornu-damae]|uniref:Uncharacterized protein n=1 Tax=Trichoderma cornu-damae TaxID=654480 RepID=A0A9P8QJ20_9HYPO|nr:hypothetical protein Trco_003614 [Trichoderma cornu-damae]
MMESRPPTQKSKSVTFSVPLQSRKPPRPESSSPTAVQVPGEDGLLTMEELRRLLPASFRHGQAWIGSPDKRVHRFLMDDLEMDRLTEVLSYFFMLGKASPPRPLHYQLALGLDIFVTERMDTHLLWAKGKIFIKPLPRYMLEPQFWAEYLDCPEDCPNHLDFMLLRASGPARRGRRATLRGPCDHSKLWKCAMGFVYSYIALIAHESDFGIAKSKGLVPEEVDFQGWKAFVSRMLVSGRIYGQMDERFTYGELDLARLNKLFMFRHPIRYVLQWNECHGFFQDHVSLLPSLTIYMAVVLATMQASTVVAKLQENKTLVLVMYGSVCPFPARPGSLSRR